MKNLTTQELLTTAKNNHFITFDNVFTSYLSNSFNKSFNFYTSFNFSDYCIQSTNNILYLVDGSNLDSVLLFSLAGLSIGFHLQLSDMDYNTAFRLLNPEELREFLNNDKTLLQVLLGYTPGVISFLCLIYKLS